jgi:membrane protein implicated in regulation of membrane protease activity
MQDYFLWWIAAAAFVSAELLTGSFYLFVLGGAAAVAAVAAHLGFSGVGQLGVAAAITLVGCYLVHIWKKKTAHLHPEQASLDVGQLVTVNSWLDATHARVSYRGSTWAAELAPEATANQAQYRIKTTQANTLIIY